MRLIADLVRGKSVESALTTLKLARKRGIPIIRKLILSAKANAVNNHNMDEKNLFVSEVYVNEGATLKRVRPRARGRADRVMKRSSHTTVILGER
jgi:large subunit ribosomal protein L22